MTSLDPSALTRRPTRRPRPMLWEPLASTLATCSRKDALVPNLILLFFFLLEIYVECLALTLQDGHKFTEPPSNSRLSRWSGLEKRDPLIVSLVSETAKKRKLSLFINSVLNGVV